MLMTSRRLPRHLLIASTALFGASLMGFSALAAYDPSVNPDATLSVTNNPSVVAPAPRTYAPQLQPVQMPDQPLYPSRVEPLAGASAFPPVDDATAAQAQQIIQAQPMADTAAADTSGFIAPAPVLADGAAQPTQSSPEPLGAIAIAPVTPIIIPKPANAPVAVAAAPAPSGEALSNDTKTILSHIPSKLDTVKTKAQKMDVARMKEPTKKLSDPATLQAYDSVGISIKVRRPGLDSNYELNRAYTALMGGDTTSAVEIYKGILSSDTTNEDALFGLASTFHRLGEIEKARPLYGALLKINPNHREGLNNFLVLVSDESPQEALAELERLEQRNPDFSPIPAQEAVLFDKLGMADQARDKMLRAIELAPENLTYKYNLAIMLDRQGSYADASALYRMLIESSLRGATIPTSIDNLQKRLNYITTAAAEGRANGV